MWLYLLGSGLLTVLGIYSSLRYSDYIIDTIQYFYPTVLLKFKTSDNKVSLTIDDSPSPYTPQILDILKKHNCKATFFVIGSYIEKYDKDGIILKRIIDEGHEIGNHMNENHAGILRLESLENSIKDCENKVKKFVPISNFFRPGCGFFNQKMIDIIEKLNYKLVLGNIYPFDPHLKIPNHHVNFVMEKLSNGSIIILHDLEYNIETFEKLLPLIKEKNFDVGKLSSFQ